MEDGRKNNAKNLKGFLFQKGQSGNPLGGKLHNPEKKELKLIKKLSKEELKEIANIILQTDMEMLKKIVETKKYRNKKLTVIQAMVASVAMRIIAKGDAQGFDIFLNRLIGKVKEEVEYSGKPPVQVLIELPDNGMTAPVDFIENGNEISNKD